MDVPITVREAMAGGTITIPTVDGQVNLKVPPMSQSGQILKLKGKGATHPRTKQKGDLFVKLVVKVPKTDDPAALKAVEQMDGYYKEDLRKDMRL
jgi:DnaJ-class molecular chaperone